MKNMYGIALALVADAFKNKLDAQGEPYFLHCLTVANNVPKEDRIPAILHDYVEDIFPDNHQKGLDYLKSLGFAYDDIAIVGILTHNKDEDYLGAYIKRIALVPRAVKIKKADLEHNCNIARIKGALSKAHFDRTEKYHTAYQYLSKI